MLAIRVFNLGTIGMFSGDIPVYDEQIKMQTFKGHFLALC
jgi:hypothetical protein